MEGTRENQGIKERPGTWESERVLGRCQSATDVTNAVQGSDDVSSHTRSTTPF